MNAPRPRRVAFFTIGQSPRSDVVPPMAGYLGPHITVDEYGVLDGLDAGQMQAMAPRPGEYCFATRLRDGSQIELDKGAAENRLAELMRSMDSRGYDALVPLCTGTAIAPMRTLVLEPQQLVDHTLVGLARHCRKVGLMVPLAAQLEGFHMAAQLPCEMRLAHASPYESTPRVAAQAFARAGQALSDCDLIVMHCMGYVESMRLAVATASGRPVLLSNRLVAQALAQVLE